MAQLSIPMDVWFPMGVLTPLAPKMVLNKQLDRIFHGPKFWRNMVHAQNTAHEPRLPKTRLRAYMINNDTRADTLDAGGIWILGGTLGPGSPGIIPPTDTLPTVRN